mmetsp:Transcript_97755/g.273593  ORF Transcript_97755/g.273593 Transcript_97755/m.273593 type:complete len:441 (-) Transcript_97755:469-1791(-)
MASAPLHDDARRSLHVSPDVRLVCHARLGRRAVLVRAAADAIRAAADPNLGGHRADADLCEQLREDAPRALAPRPLHVEPRAGRRAGATKGRGAGRVEGGDAHGPRRRLHELLRLGLFGGRQLRAAQAPPCRPLGPRDPRAPPGHLRAPGGTPGVAAPRAAGEKGRVAVPVLRRLCASRDDFRDEPVPQRDRVLLDGLRRRAGRRPLGQRRRGDHHGLHGHRHGGHRLLPDPLRGAVPPAPHRRGLGRVARGDLRRDDVRGLRREDPQGVDRAPALPLDAARGLCGKRPVAVQGALRLRHSRAGERRVAAHEVPGRLVLGRLRLACEGQEGGPEAEGIHAGEGGPRAAERPPPRCRRGCHGPDDLHGALGADRRAARGGLRPALLRAARGAVGDRGRCEHRHGPRQAPAREARGVGLPGRHVDAHPPLALGPLRAPEHVQ